MTWSALTVRLTARARRDLRRFNRETGGRVLRAVRHYAETGLGDVKRLQGRDGFRLRVGDWRVIFEVEGDELVMLVLRVAPRGGAYK